MNLAKTTYFSRLLCDEAKGGGDKRVHQIYTAFLKHIDIEIVSAPTVTITSAPKQNASLSSALFYWSSDYVETCIWLNSIAEYWVNHIKNYSIGDFVVIDDPIYFAPLIDYFNSQNIPIIACIHNIESLVPHQVKEKYKNKFFELELSYIKKCDAVITISREDELLLNNFDVKNITYLPYVPSPKVYKRLQQIREKRKKTSKEKFLYFGHMNNYPTKEGAITVGNYFAKQQEKVVEENRLIITGFSANLLKETFNDSVFVELRENLSNDLLDDLLTKIKACICFQNQATGALTKIPELLIAGVPILGNNIALRNYHHLQGIFHFSSFVEMVSLTPQIDEQNKIGFPFSKNAVSSSLIKAIIHSIKRIKRVPQRNTPKIEQKLDVMSNKEENIVDYYTNNKEEQLKNQLIDQALILDKKAYINKKQKQELNLLNQKIKLQKNFINQHNSILFLLKRLLKELKLRIKGKIKI